MGRQTRLAALARQREQGDSDPIDIVGHRADALAQRSAELEQLADAWKSLYSSLSPDQKAEAAPLRGTYSSHGAKGRRTSSNAERRRER